MVLLRTGKSQSPFPLQFPHVILKDTFKFLGLVAFNSPFHFFKAEVAFKENDKILLVVVILFLV